MFKTICVYIRVHDSFIRNASSGIFKKPEKRPLFGQKQILPSWSFNLINYIFF